MRGLSPDPSLSSFQVVRGGSPLKQMPLEKLGSLHTNPLADSSGPESQAREKQLSPTMQVRRACRLPAAGGLRCRQAPSKCLCSWDGINRVTCLLLECASPVP